MGNIFDTPAGLEEENDFILDGPIQQEIDLIGYLDQVKDCSSFDSLPDICKMKILSHLSIAQKGIASQVCSEWRNLLQSPMVWSNVDLALQPQSDLYRKQQLFDSKSIDEYGDRLCSILSYLSALDPPVHRLCFTYDICYHNSGFLESLLVFLATPGTRCSELSRARLIWNSMTDTEPDESSDLEPTQQLSERLRKRQRLFVKFFQSFVNIAPNVRHLELPFDWSPPSVKCLLKLNELISLNLRRYFLYQSVEPVVISQLLTGLIHLRVLRLDIWTASGNGLLGYGIRSQSLVEVDASACRGIYISELDLPALKSVRLECRPWSGPISSSPATTSEFIRGLPCLYDLLTAGAPNLKKINGHRLQSDWRDHLYPALDVIMSVACPCRAHYHSDYRVQVNVQHYVQCAAGVTYRKPERKRSISASTDCDDRHYDTITKTL